MDNIAFIFKQILYMGAASSILALIILITKKVFNKALSPKWHYYIWILLIIRLLIPFSFKSPISVYNLFNTAAEKANISVSDVQSMVDIKDTLNSNNTMSKVPDVNTKTNASSSADFLNDYQGKGNALETTNTKETSTTSKYNLIITIMAFVWLTGVIMLTFYTVIANAHFILEARRYKPLNNENINCILEKCKNSMNIKRNIPIVTTKKRRTPSLLGLLNPKILISKIDIENLTEDEIRHVFLHELSHYKRKDILINWIMVLLQIVHFFNPIIWYAFYKMREDCEVSCDAAALKYLKENEYNGYGKTIIKLLKTSFQSNFIPVTAGMSKNKSSYKRRILMISKFKKKSVFSTIISVVLIVFVGGIGLTSCASKAPAKADDTKIENSAGTNKVDTPVSTDDKQKEDENKADNKTNTSSTTNKLSKADTALQAYKAVLQNKGEFFNTENKKNVYLNNFLANNGGFDVVFETLHFAVVDMDGDEIPEVVIELAINGNDYAEFYEVLHYSADGKVYGYIFSNRALGDVKIDGTFSYSSGAYDNGFGKLRFQDGSSVTDSIGHKESKASNNQDEPYVEEYFIGNKQVTPDKYESFEKEQLAKKDTTWYEFSPNSIEKELSKNQ